jgi:hypothetical protein
LVTARRFADFSTLLGTGIAQEWSRSKSRNFECVGIFGITPIQFCPLLPPKRLSEHPIGMFDEHLQRNCGHPADLPHIIPVMSDEGAPRSSDVPTSRIFWASRTYNDPRTNKRRSRKYNPPRRICDGN